MPSPSAAALSASRYLGWTPSLAGVVGAVMVFAGLVIGLRPLHDNSFLTHFATGRLIWDTGHIPHADVYSFTAPGHDWVVQSWIPSIVYGGVDRLAGTGGLVVLTGLLTAIAAWLLWVLTPPAESVLGRLLIVTPALTVGTISYGPRPLMFGVVLFSLTLVAAQGRLDPRWLIPGYWVWVNSHGSWPLGLLALGLLAIGSRLDGDDVAVELRALRFAVIGTIAGGVNPLGPRLLVFPLELLQRQDVLHNIVEWAPPKFERLSERAFLVVLVMAIVLLVRRPKWRAAVPMVVFTVLALLSLRNIGMAGVVLAATAAPAMRGLGSLRGDERRPVYRPAMVLVSALSCVMVLSAPRGGNSLALGGYPEEALAYGIEHQLITPEARMLAPDYVGNLMELAYGGRIPVFIDDRYDMYPDQVIDDYGTVLDAKPEWAEVLERWQISVVVWKADAPLTQFLQLSGDWDFPYRDDDWVVAVPR